MELYTSIVGPAWSNLNEVVRKFHSTGAQMRGSFTVRHGTGFITRLTLWLMRLPAAGETIETTLFVTPFKDGERWQRTFAGNTFITEQRAARGQLLAERFGLFEVLFHLNVEKGALFYRQARVALRLGSLPVPLPRWLAPQIVASESAQMNESRVHVSVRVNAPLMGLLIEYMGEIELEGATA